MCQFKGYNFGPYPPVPIVVLAAITAAEAVSNLNPITRLEVHLVK